MKGNDEEDKSPTCRRETKREKVGSPVSARKLAATLWRMQLVGPEKNADDEQLKKNKKKVKENDEDRLGFKVRLTSYLRLKISSLFF